LILFNEFVDRVHKTGLNDMLMNRPDPVLKFNSLTHLSSHIR